MLSLALLAFVVFLPPLVNRKVNQVLQGLMSRGGAEFRLLHVGLTRSDLSIVFSDDVSPSPAPAKIESCVLEYRPVQLLRGHIDSVRLNGVSLHAVATNGTIRIPALELFVKKSGVQKPFSLRNLEDLPVTVGHFQAEGHLVVDAAKERVVIPLSFSGASVAERSGAPMTVRADVLFSTSRLSLDVGVQAKTETLDLLLDGVWDSDSMPPALRRSLPPTLRRVSSDFTAKASVQFTGSSVADLRIQANGHARVESPAGTVELHPTLAIHGNGSRIEASLTGLKTQARGIPLSLDVTNVVAQIPERSVRGQVVIGCGEGNPTIIDIVCSPESASAHVAGGTLGPSGKVDAGKYVIDYDGLHLSSTASFDATKAPVKLSGQFGVHHLHIRDSEGRLLVSFNQGMVLDLGVEKTNGVLSANAGVSAPETALSQAGLSLKGTALQLGGQNAGQGMRLSGSAQSTADWQGVEIGKIRASLAQTNQVYAVDGTIQAVGVTGLFSSLLDPHALGGSTLSNSFAITEQALDLSRLPALVPQLEGFEIGGKLSASAVYVITPKSQYGSFKSKVTEGRVDCQAKGVSVSDLRFSFDLPELPDLSSNSQFLGFKNLKIGKFFLDSGLAVFRMESPDVWYLDKLILGWCEGKVRAESTRISRKNITTWITAHADRLKLSSFLEQTGAGSDAGESGRISGTIPITIKDGKITFRDGYLYSTPGKPGRVLLNPSQAMLGAAGDSIETSLAIDALSDFSYSWLRLGLNSADDKLLLRFEVDGKPTNKLFYFVGEKGIVKSKNATHFEGIVLDATFKIPIQDTLSLVKPLNNLMKEKSDKPHDAALPQTEAASPETNP